MLFTIQTYIEEYLNKRSLVDSDGYAVRLANLYFYHRSNIENVQFLSRVGRIRTLLFLNNGIKERKKFESSLVRLLDNRFKKKSNPDTPSFPGGTENEKKRFQQFPRLTIEILMNEFTHATETKAIDAFWISRVNGRLKPGPEKIAQSLFAMFTKGTLVNRSGIVLREFQSGIGFVDIGIILSSTLHLIEIKILTGEFIGFNQLEQYMKSERRREGSLLIFDSLKPTAKIQMPSHITTSSGIIKTYCVDINPGPPSGLN